MGRLEDRERRAQVSEIGRNDPCPCGSGKKYKHCCLVRQSAIAGSLPRWREAEGRLLARLVDYTRDKVKDGAREKAFRLFFGTDGDDPALARVAGAGAGFVDWLAFDYRSRESTRRFSERFRMEEGANLPEDEGRLLIDWFGSYRGVFEVTVLYPGRGMDVIDIFSGERFAVTETTASRRLIKYDLVYTRLLKVFETHTISGDLVGIPRTWGESLRAWFDRERTRYFQRHPGTTYREFMKARTHSLHRFIVRRTVNPVLPKLMIDGEQFVFAKATFGVRDYVAVVDALRRSRVFRETGEGGSGKLLFSWSEQPTAREAESEGAAKEASLESDVGQGFRRVLGTVELKGDLLVLETQSRKRLASGKALLRGLLGEMVVHRADSFMDPAQALAFAAPWAEGASAPAELPLEIQQQIVTKAMDDHYHRWVDQPLPGLGGLTPREVYARAEGRAALEAVLRDIENFQERNRMEGRPSYDVGRIRRWLRL